MRIVRPCLVIVALTLLLCACASEPRKSIFPPKASIQQLARQTDGSWKLQLRLQNFSEAAMTFATVDAKIEIAGIEAGSVSVAPAIRVLPESAEVVEAALKPSSGASARLAVVAPGESVKYKISGHIVTSEPKGNYEFTFESRLSPVPGLDGVLR